jgi:hypothetical protein
MDSKMEEALGELICRLNPYTHEMDIYVGNPDPSKFDNNPRQLDLEVDTKYPGEWAFKGQSQRINTSIRLRYRYPVRTKKPDGTPDPKGEILYWLDDYVLIGYEGAGGP